jgi:predicted Zn-dependent protease
MEPLEHPHAFLLAAAQGWVELGDCREAANELDRLPPELHQHPDVLELRWQIAVKAERWEDALQVAETLCHLVPESPFGWIHRSYCLHELKRTQEAWDLLLPVAERFPGEWLISYNLACYACQLGRLDEGKSWFMRAIELGDPLKVNRLAAKDPDLRPLFQQQA